MLKRWRRQTGVRAPKLSIRPEWPMHWRVTSVLVLSATALAMAGWIYDAGRKFAGFDQSESGELLKELSSQVESLNAELIDVRRVADSSAAKLQVEVTAQEKLATLIKGLEEENSRLKAELAVFESLAGNDHAIPKLAINRFDLARDSAPGSFQYKLLVTKAGAGADRSFKGRIELFVTVQRGESIDIISVSGGVSSADALVQFRLFKRIEGKFSIPVESELKSVEARLIEDGQVRASKSVVLAGN